jgi:hypothetical protein
MAVARPRARNRNAAELTLKALRDLGRLEPVDAATVGLLRTTADALDDLSLTDPARMGSIARVHLAALRFLRGMPADEPHDELSELMTMLRAGGPMAGPMGDALE